MYLRQRQQGDEAGHATDQRRVPGDTRRRPKQINGNITWQDDEDHSPSVEFRAEVVSQPGWPLFVRGSHHRVIGTLSYMLILPTAGRIYGLDLGKDHHNPGCEQVGDTHKHQWSEQYRDKQAYVPAGITAGRADPVAVWEQFCAEARLTHHGTLATPPAVQGELPL